MKVTITKKDKNELLHRFELEGSIEFDAVTPSNVQLAEALAKEVKLDISLVVVKQILTTFSQKTANFKAVVYRSAEDKTKVEKDTKHMKKVAEKAAEEAKKAKEEAAKKAEEEKAAAEAAKEAPVEEVKAEEPAPAVEEKKEEKVEEEKAEEATPAAQ